MADSEDEFGSIPYSAKQDTDEFDSIPYNKKPKKSEDLFFPMMGSPATQLMQQGAEVGKTPAGRIGLEAAAAIPFGLAEAPAWLATRTAGLHSIPRYLTELLGATGKNVAFGEVAGQVPTSPQDDRSMLEKGKEALIPSILAGVLGKPITDVAGMIRPSKFLRGKLSPEELKNNLEMTSGTETGLGDVIQSPFLKRQYENVLTKVPFSGATEAMQRTGTQVTEKGKNLLDKLSGGHAPEEANAVMNEELLKNYEKHKLEKESLYTGANNIADKVGLQITTPNFNENLNKYMSALESSATLKNDPEAVALLSKLKKYSIGEPTVSGLGANALPIIETPSLKEVNLLKAKMNQFSNAAKFSPDANERAKYGIFKNLARSLKNDIKSSIDESGNPALKKAYLDAEENYSKKFSNFLDKDIYKYISGSADKDMLTQSFLRTGLRSDRATMVGKLTKTLPDEKKNLLSYSYLSNALDNEGVLNPSKLGTLIKKLKPNQFKALVPDASLRKELTNFSKLTSMNSNALNVMHNPATGQRNLDVLASMLAVHGLGGAAGYHEGGVGGALAGLALPAIGGRAATHLLTSPKVRENLLKKMLNPTTSGKANYIQGLATLLANQPQGSE